MVRVTRAHKASSREKQSSKKITSSWEKQPRTCAMNALYPLSSRKWLIAIAISVMEVGPP